MSIKVGILNDGTQLLADIKEVTDGDQTQYMVIKPFEVVYTCLLYTSDAADE